MKSARLNALGTILFILTYLGVAAIVFDDYQRPSSPHKGLIPDLVYPITWILAILLLVVNIWLSLKMGDCCFF